MKSNLAGRLDEKAFNMRNCSETMLEGNMGYNMALKLGECYIYIHTCYMYISNQSVNVQQFPMVTPCYSKETNSFMYRQIQK